MPSVPDTERAARYMTVLGEVGRRLAALPDGTAVATTGRGDHKQAGELLRSAWREGIEHRVQLAALQSGGLLTFDIPRSGWEPELLRALDRAVSFTPLS
ncbi:hypothetical protein ACFVFF_38875 [Streptomyces sp. NPDC057680]|uniref:hypothetical protein n=1 Tax=Streptomyces sp. NPDC057680 TaxID=3346208 RepID=UPI0036C1C43C